MRVSYFAITASVALAAFSSSGRAEPQLPFCGAHRAEIAGTADPEGRGRVSILAPALGVTTPVWAERALPAKGATPRRALAGDGVWIVFEACEAARPVMIGFIAPSA
jgi:hypothetical protein